MPVLSGGRYDALIGDFGSSHPATGFAVNINAVAGALLSKNAASLGQIPQVLVYADKDNLEQGFIYCRNLIAKGIKAENSLHASLEEAKEYASRKGIPVIDIVDKTGKSESIRKDQSI